MAVSPSERAPRRVPSPLPPVPLPSAAPPPALSLRTQLVRFVLTGGLSAVVDFGLLLVLTHAGLSDGWAKGGGVGETAPREGKPDGYPATKCGPGEALETECEADILDVDGVNKP